MNGSSSMTTIALFLLSLLSGLLSAPGAYVVSGQTESVLSVSPTQTSISSGSFVVDVRLDLAQGEAINTYEMRVLYNQAVLNATRIEVGGIVPPDRVQEFVNCVDAGAEGASALGCGIDDRPGVVSSTALFLDIVAGPVSATLFRVHFSVVTLGSSILDITNDTLVNPGLTYINPRPIIHRTNDGVFSNKGPAALFNVSPAILVVGRQLGFDAAGSFNPDGPSIVSHTWDFGDETQPSSGSMVFHTYSSVGSYDVKLNITDGSNLKDSITMTIQVVSQLGKIQVTVKDAKGSDIRSNVTVNLYAGVSLLKTETKLPFARVVVLSDLPARAYRVEFIGVGIVPFSKEETVIEGWTTVDAVFLELVGQTQGGPQDMAPLIYASIIGAGLSLGSLAIIVNRRKDRKKKGAAARKRIRV